ADPVQRDGQRLDEGGGAKAYPLRDAQAARGLDTHVLRVGAGQVAEAERAHGGAADAVARQACAALAAGHVGQRHHWLPHLPARHAGPEPCHLAGELVAHDRAGWEGRRRMEVRAADAAVAHPDQQLAGLRFGPRDLLDDETARFSQHRGAHGTLRPGAGRYTWAREPVNMARDRLSRPAPPPARGSSGSTWPEAARR